MARKATQEEIVQAQARLVGMLNEIDAVLTGWVLGHPREQVEKLTGPLYDLLDQDPPTATS